MPLASSPASTSKAASACASKTSSSRPTPGRSASTTRRATSRSSADRRRLRVKLDGATFLLQWATGGLAFLWVTTRHREVSLGYGWLLRGGYGVMAIGAGGVFAAQGVGGGGGRLAVPGTDRRGPSAPGGPRRAGGRPR